MNILDLGFFNSIQSLQHKTTCRTVDELISAVKNAYAQLDCDTLNKVFLTHQQCMVEIMKVDGGNKYHLLHMGKDHLQRSGQLPFTISCDMNLVTKVKNMVNLSV